MLGIIVGSATIVLVIAIGNGGKIAVEEQFSNLNAEVITIASGRGADAQKLSLEDLDYIVENTDKVKNATILLQGNGSMSYQSQTITGTGIGIYEEFFEISNLQVQYGRSIDENDNAKRSRVIVIGYELANQLFEDAPGDAIGESVKINGKKYEIVGVTEQSGKMVGFTSADEAIYFPYVTYETYMVNNTASPQLQIQANSVEETLPLNDEIEQLLNEKYLADGGHEFRIRNAGSMLTAAQDSANTMSMLLVSVAVIVLVVGGIGIMNVLFVSVKERTKEIGILKALGAKRQTILLTFLLESIAVSILGSFFGIILSIGLIPLMGLLNVTAVASFDAYILAVLFAIITGTFFGYYPALTASKLSPIEALRSE